MAKRLAYKQREENGRTFISGKNFILNEQTSTKTNYACYKYCQRINEENEMKQLIDIRQ